MNISKNIVNHEFKELYHINYFQKKKKNVN